MLCPWALATLSGGLIPSGCRSNKRIRRPPRSAVVGTGAVASATALDDSPTTSTAPHDAVGDAAKGAPPAPAVAASSVLITGPE